MPVEEGDQGLGKNSGSSGASVAPSEGRTGAKYDGTPAGALQTRAFWRGRLAPPPSPRPIARARRRGRFTRHQSVSRPSPPILFRSNDLRQWKAAFADMSETQSRLALRLIRMSRIRVPLHRCRTLRTPILISSSMRRSDHVAGIVFRPDCRLSHRKRYGPWGRRGTSSHDNTTVPSRRQGGAACFGQNGRRRRQAMCHAPVRIGQLLGFW